MQTQRDKTVGAASLELATNNYQRQSVVETQQEMLKNYKDELIKCAKAGEKEYGRDKPFYVCVQQRKERLLHNVIRNMFYTRQTRPSPTYDLALYYYDPKDESLQFVWNIPDKETVQYMLKFENEIPEEESKLLWFCKCFSAGTLV